MNKKAKIALISALVLVAILVVSIAMAAKPACKDGKDNDGDDLIDYPADPGCTSPTDRDEYNDPLPYCGDSECNGDEVCDVCVADCGYCDSCSDTDGYDRYTLGTASGYLNDIWYSDDDYCVDASSVNEYYCLGDYEYSTNLNCGTDTTGNNTCVGDDVYRYDTDYFCASGACDSTVTPVLVEECDYGCTDGECDPIPDSCSDTDGGYYLFIFGTTSGYLGEVPYSNDDYCVDASSVKEYYCVGDSEQSTSVSCGTDSYANGTYCSGSEVYNDYIDYFCASGACDLNSTPVFQEDCDNYDAYGANYCSEGDVYRDYNNYFCSAGACDYTSTPELVEECDYGCTAGECDGIPDSCSDTDGWDYFTQGTASGYYNEIWYSDTDYCLDGYNLREYYCSGNYEYYTDFECGTPGNATFICSNGACV